MTALDRVAPYDFQLAIWGYDTAGQVAEHTAMIAEQPAWVETPNGYPLWDRDTDWLASIKLCDGTTYGCPPSWWALPHVA